MKSIAISVLESKIERHNDNIKDLRERIDRKLLELELITCLIEEIKVCEEASRVPESDLKAQIESEQRRANELTKGVKGHIEMTLRDPPSELPIVMPKHHKDELDAVKERIEQGKIDRGEK
jgi:hypothetical protein